MNVGDFFGPGGILSNIGYSTRDGQIRMAKAVEEALLCERSLMVEAPTGTGKSLAYLVPAIQWALDNKSTVVVATANIALQEQLINKDLPLLRDLLGEFSFALAKGRSNYLCLHATDDAEPDVREEFFPQLDDVLEWGSQTQTGDMSELNFEPHFSVKQAVTVSSDDCLGKKCPRKDDCFANAAKKKLNGCHVVVTNYAMLFANMRVIDATDGFASILPPFRILIMDEAHKAADIARDFFGQRVTAAGMRRIVSRLRDKSKNLRQDVVNESEALFGQLGRLVTQNTPSIKSRLPVNAERAIYLLAQVGETYEALWIASEQAAQQDAAVYEKCRRRAAEYARTLQDLLLMQPEQHVHFFDVSGHTLALASKPVDIAEELRLRLSGTTLIATSATLTVGGDFRPLARDLGMEESDTLSVDSPFDHEQQAAVAIYPSAPDPNDPAFPLWCAAEIEKIARASGGRLLGLFTSYKNLDVTHARLKAARLPFKVLRQNDAPRTKLVEQFKNDVTSVLLGTDSFWAGVDVPGEACSVVVIDKIPFPMRSDPVLDVVIARDPKGWFMKYSLPRAVIQFRQGAGRLIRSASDRGVIVILDSRLSTKRYSKLFLKSLPCMTVYRDDSIGAVEAVLGKQREQQQQPLFAE